MSDLDGNTEERLSRTAHQMSDMIRTPVSHSGHIKEGFTEIGSVSL